MIFTVYPGRFHPFHDGHLQAYNWMRRQYEQPQWPSRGIIAISKSCNSSNSPLTAWERILLMVAKGMPLDNIVTVASPYAPTEILPMVNQRVDRLVYFVSAKDNERFIGRGHKVDGTPEYLQLWTSDADMKPIDEHAYIRFMPTFTTGRVDTSDTKISARYNGTEFRTTYATGTLEVRKTLIAHLYPRCNPSLQNQIGELFDSRFVS